MPELEKLFSEAIALQDPAAQRAYIESACGTDVGLKNRIGALVQANRRAARFMSEPVGLVDWDLQDADGVPLGEQPGDIIGRYQLEKPLGEGGMGSVFLARQQEPVQRDVALKVIKPGLDSREVISRFESERQALALMDHPNIARAYDAGTTPSGRPYFVMEYVDGKSICEYCQDRQLDPRCRLELFLSVCDAIQHAHQKGVIHRDIKPQNILVTECSGIAEPKIIDFGIAKATKQALGGDPTVTRFGQFIGTPVYMSPEQADAGAVDIDTRSDVYSLGATLYELLTDAAPFDESALRQKSSAEVYQVIREKVPALPSVAVSTQGRAAATEIAAARHATAQQLRSTLARDLDWIVMRAMDKDRQRRYESAAALADDLRRYLRNEPIVARPPTARYRIGKFFVRNKLAVVASAAIAVILLLATCISSGFAYWALQSLRKAEVQSQIAHDENATREAYQTFLKEEVFAQASPWEEPNRNVTLRFVMDRAAQRIDQGSLRPDVEAAVRTTLGQTYRGLGEYDQSLTHLRRAHELYSRKAGEDDRQPPATRALQSAHAANELATTLLHLATFDEARRHLEASQSVAATLKDSELQLQTWQLLAVYNEAIGNPNQAESLLKDVLREQTSRYGEQHVATYRAAADLAYVYQSQGRMGEALELLEPTYQALQQQAPFHSLTLQAAVRLARLSVLVGNTNRADELYRQVSNDLARVYGEDHPQTMQAKHGWALVQASLQQLPQAHQLLEEVLKHQRVLLGDDHPSTLSTMHNLGQIRVRMGDRSGAEALFQAAVAGQQRLRGLADDATRDALSTLAFFYLEQSRFTDAIPYYEALRESFPAVELPDRRRLTSQVMLGLCRLQLGDVAVAREVLATAANECRQYFSDDWLLPVVEGLLGETHWRLGDRGLAELTLVRSYEQLQVQEINLPASWRPLGLRAATRRLAEFYESAGTEDERARARDYRAEYEHIGEFGAIQDDEESESIEDGNTY